MVRTIFWPIDEKEIGYVFGWKGANTIVIAGTCIFGSPNDATRALTRINSPFTDGNSVVSPLELLGTVSSRNVTYATQVDWQDPDVGVDHSSVIYYSRPKYGSMRHYSLLGINLDKLLTIQSPEGINSSLTAQQSRSQLSQSGFVEKRHCSLQGIDPCTISQMNTADRFMSRVKGPARHRSTRWRVPTSLRIRLSCIRRIFQASANFLSFLRNNMLHLCDLGPYVYLLLASAQQLDLRCEQTIFVLRQSWLLDRTKETSNNDLSSHYISTQNCIWLILNDIIIGTAVGIFLVDNKVRLARMIHDFVLVRSVVSIRQAIFWLDNWPAGLKLNTELSRFLYLLSNALLDSSEVVLNFVGRLLPVTIAAIGMSGALGMTMILASLSDLIKLLSAHISISYTIVRVAFKTQLSMARSLFNLFRGKRYNVLRQRVDDWNYDLDQLLLGAMLLTLINFLFPTITVYYVLFAITRLGILLLQAGLQIALALLNHFPLFALTLRIKDPRRLPGGIVFRPYRAGQTDQRGLIVENLPITLSKIFGQYSVLGARLAAHYNPSRLILELLRGNPLKSIPQNSIRYTYDTLGPQQSTTHQR